MIRSRSSLISPSLNSFGFEIGLNISTSFFAFFPTFHSRDLIIAMNKYPLHLQDQPTIPLSDGAGVITEVGSNVTKWKKDDRVMSIFNQIHLKGIAPDAKEFKSALGGSVDGMLSQYRVVSSCNEEYRLKVQFSLHPRVFFLSLSLPHTAPSELSS